MAESDKKYLDASVNYILGMQVKHTIADTLKDLADL